MSTLRLTFLIALLCAAAAAPARADDDGKWSGCNRWGCWYNGGGCNMWGCWSSLDAYILRKRTDRSPEAVRGETLDGLVQDFVQAGLRKLGSSVIATDFRDGVRQGVRVRLDNRDDVYLLDAFAWRRADGDVVVALFTYKSGDADLALRFLPTITQSVQ